MFIDSSHSDQYNVIYSCRRTDINDYLINVTCLANWPYVTSAPKAAI